MNDSIEDIRNQLNSSDASERKIALVRVARSRPQGVLTEVIDSLQDLDDDVRSTAAWALDLLGDPDAVPSLVQALYDPTFDVRSNAGWALVHLAQRISPHLVVPDMIDVLQASENYDARQMAWLVLKNIGGREATEAIDQYWE